MRQFPKDTNITPYHCVILKNVGPTCYYGTPVTGVAFPNFAEYV